MPKSAKFQSGTDAFEIWRRRVETGEKDPVYAAGDGELSRFALAPGRVTLLGGAPGQGKTAFSMQMCMDALRLNPTIRACICNIEMGIGALLDRQLSRISGIDLQVIRDRRFGPEHSDRLDAAMSTIQDVIDRIAFVSPPYVLSNVAAVVDAEEAQLLLLDYIQRIRPPGDHGDKRGSVDAVMDYLRKFADEGMAVFVIAAVARTKDRRGRSSYDGDGLGLASFRESSELEFGADDAYLLVPEKGDPDLVVLKHLKARHGEPRDMVLEFNRSLQRFTPPRGASPEVEQELKAAWTKRRGARA